jgi:hypothetical protein
MGIKVANNAFATLAAGISDSATSITVASGQGARFPTLGAGDYFYATLVDTANQLEIVKCTARSGDALTVVRAQESTVARAYDAGDRIEIRITAQTFADASSTVSGNLAFTGTGNRITGDFSSIAPNVNRVMFQTSTENGNTLVTAIPNGTATQANFILANNSDLTNASTTVLLANATESRLTAGRTGTGTFNPLTFNTGGGERVRIDTSGVMGIGTSSPSAFATRLAVVGGSTYFDGQIYQVNAYATLGNFNAGTTSASPPDAAISFSTNITNGQAESDIWNGNDPSLYPNTGILFTQRLTSTTRRDLMFLHNNGNVGIGTSSPSTPLDVQANSSGLGIRVRGRAANDGGNIAFFSNNNATEQLSIFSSSTENAFFGTGSRFMSFSTNNTERMRIDSSGDLLVGRTSSLSAKLGITSAPSQGSINCGDAADGTTYGIVQICRASDQPDNKFHLSFIRTGFAIAGMGFLDNSSTFAIQNGGNNSSAGVGLTNGATSWSTVSDERKKNIIGSVEDALNKIADWRSVYFKYKTDDEDTPRRVGLIAQDVQSTLPEAVSVEEDELKTLQVRYTETVPLLVKAIQEQQALIEQLKADVAALKGAQE